MIVVGEFSGRREDFGSSAESFEHSTDIGPILHWDDSQLIFFVYPHEESFFVVVVDSSATGPVSVQTSELKESVSLFEQEMVIDQLLLVFRTHCFERIEFSSKISSQGLGKLFKSIN